MPFFGSLGTFGLSKLVVVFVPPVVNPLTNSGGQDAFVVKYNSDGIPLWSRRLGGTNNDQMFSVSTDLSGNIIVAGHYLSAPLNIFAANGSTVSFTLSNNGVNDAFVVKYNSSGTPVWVRRMTGTSGSETSRSVSTDSSGNVIVAGYFASTSMNIYAADGTTVSFTLNRSASVDAFIVKYDSSGTPLWAIRIAGDDSDFGFAVHTDSSQNVIVGGYYSSTSLAGGFTPQLSNSGFANAFVAKYNSSGTALWGRRLGGAGFDLTNSIRTDSSQNVIVAGSFSSNPLNIFAANGSTVSFTLANSGGQDIFIVKYDSSGTPLWARRISGTGGDQGTSVSTDSSGNIIVAGNHTSGSLNIFAANGSTVSFTLANSGSNDAFIVKYDSSGTPLWARRLGGTGADEAISVSTDSGGNIVVAGQYGSTSLNIFAANGSTVSFTLANSGTGGTTDAFIVKYDSSGTPLWAKRTGGTGADEAMSVSTDSDGNIVVAGQYASTSLSFS